MPAATVSDSFSHFLFAEPSPVAATSFLRLVEGLAAAEFRERDRLLRPAEELFESAAPAPLRFWLTTQEIDLFGNERPYDTDPLLDFVFAGPKVETRPLRRYRLCTPTEIGAYCDLLDALLASPTVIEDERDVIVSVGIQLRKVKSGCVLVGFRQSY